MTTCTICDGTGFDTAFGSPCDCARFTGRRFGLAAQHLSGNATYGSPARSNGTGSGTTRTVVALTPEVAALVEWAAAQSWSSFAQSVAAQAPRLSDKQIAALRSMKAKSDARQATQAAERRAESKPSRRTPEVPEGRYAVENAEGVLRFYNVDRPTEGRWAGYTFLSVLASDERHSIRGEAAKAILAKIAEDPQAASIRYGHEVGRCGRCGRTLTDEDSRAAGIGPICASLPW